MPPKLPQIPQKYSNKKHHVPSDFSALRPQNNLAKNRPSIDEIISLNFSQPLSLHASRPFHQGKITVGRPKRTAPRMPQRQRR
jgi:hypothetical protein